MTVVYSKVIGNVYKNDNGNQNFTQHSPKNNSSTVCISRADMAKSRYLAKTESGDSIGIKLDRGVTLRNGDMLQDVEGRRTVIIEQALEKVGVLRFSDVNNDSYARFFLLAGHIIGNRHKPIAIKKNGRIVTFPIENDAEIETFRMLFERREMMAGMVEVGVSEEVFTPDAGANVQGHD